MHWLTLLFEVAKQPWRTGPQPSEQQNVNDEQKSSWNTRVAGNRQTTHTTGHQHMFVHVDMSTPKSMDSVLRVHSAGAHRSGSDWGGETTDRGRQKTHAKCKPTKVPSFVRLGSRHLLHDRLGSGVLRRLRCCQ